MRTICVCGAGTMGSGIAEVCAFAGYKVILYDLDNTMLNKAKERISTDLQKLVDRNKIDLLKKATTLQLIEFSADINQCISDLVIEAVVEKEPVKVDLLNKLMQLNGTGTIYCSNTSSLSINDIAKHIKFPEQFAGLHFFNPAPIMKLVEIVKGEQSSPEVIDRLLQFTEKLGKVAVVCKDSPGFIVNRVARPFYIESLRLAEKGVSIEQIDRLMESAGFKLGPFKLMDLIGNDINYAVSCSVYEQLGQPARLQPSYIQEEIVKNGELGQKTGKGYYDYPKNS